MEQLRTALQPLTGKRIKFLWFHTNNRKPTKSSGKIVTFWDKKDEKKGVCVEMYAVKWGYRWFGGCHFIIPLRDIVVLADKRLDGYALLENHSHRLGHWSNSADTALTMPEGGNVCRS